MDLKRLRDDTPGCGHRLHLNNAGAGLMPKPVLEAMQAHLRLEAEIGGYEAATARQEAIENAYTAFADLLGCRARNIAFVENATVAYAQALSAIPFEPGDIILTTEDDYISNQLAFLSLAQRLRVHIVRGPNAPEGGVDVEALRLLMDTHRPRLVAVTHIPTNSGLIQPVAAIGRLCRERDLLYLVDGCQAVGQLPLNVDELGCDFLSATCRKFLRGPRGAGFLYASDRVLGTDMTPLFVDMQGAEWTGPDTFTPFPTARRFENWEFAYALILGSGEAARYAVDLGLAPLSRRALMLAHDLRTRLQDLDGIRVLDRGPALGAIVTAHLAGWKPSALKAELDRRRINTSLSFRAYAVIDFARKGVDWALRLSPHYYNTEEEVEVVVETLAALARPRH